MMEEVLYAFPAWLIALLLLLLLVAAMEGGYRLGSRTLRKASEGSTSVFATLLGAILGVLGLLLAFALAMAVTRYELRTTLVLREANALGAVYGWTSVLEEAARMRMQGLLRVYVERRYQDHEAGRVPRQVTQDTTDLA